MLIEDIISECAGLLKYKCHFGIDFNPLWNSSLHQDTIHNFILKHDLCDIYGVITGPVCLCTQAFFARCNPGLRSWLDQKVLIGSKGHLHSMYHLLGKKTDFLLLAHCSNKYRCNFIWNHHSFKVWCYEARLKGFSPIGMQNQWPILQSNIMIT